jgi:hypothetical protein
LVPLGEPCRVDRRGGRSHCLGQAIRGAAFAVPGALGVQEGGYLLLAPLAGLPPDMALVLSLAKRAREIILGPPGLLYLRFSKAGAAAAARPEVP